LCSVEPPVPRGAIVAEVPGEPYLDEEEQQQCFLLKPEDLAQLLIAVRGDDQQGQPDETLDPLENDYSELFGFSQQSQSQDPDAERDKRAAARSKQQSMSSSSKASSNKSSSSAKSSSKDKPPGKSSTGRPASKSAKRDDADAVLVVRPCDAVRRRSAAPWDQRGPTWGTWDAADGRGMCLA